MLKPLNHLLSFVLPISTCFFLANGPHDSFAALAWTLPFWIVLLVDWLGPKVKLEPDFKMQNPFYDAILYGLAFVQLINILLMLRYVSELTWSSPDDWLTGLVNLIVLRFVVGTSSGTSAIVVAHELIHRPQAYLQKLGRFLLLSVCYEHFLITHKQGHHLSIGMPEDIATARFGESFQDYWRRVYIGHLRYAWRSEQQRVGLGDYQFAYLRIRHNQVLQGLLIELSILIFISLWFGWLAALMFLYQAFAAVRILETVNYFQHWGLADGRYGNSFGWVNDSWLTGYLFIGLANHIGHHEDESKPFYQIAYSEQGPRLPYGYFIMNLWVKLSNDSYQQMAIQELEKFQRSG